MVVGAYLCMCVFMGMYHQCEGFSTASPHFFLLLSASFSISGAIQNECVVLPILRSIKDKIDLSLIRLKL
jgi:hypothetical protein